ncbi:MAG: SagB family peptide dehydrogenase [Deltaproteobacteria bacterium]|nr:SagB family peptide dehydrogenase [Deltaproteobacteria bacterium]
MSNRSIGEVKRYHETAKRSSRGGARGATERPAGVPAFQSKFYSDLEPIPLPRDFRAPGAGALEAVSRFECNEEKSPGLAEVAEMLFYSAGRAKERSAAVELYLVATEISGLQAGVYHFDAEGFALKRLRAGDYRPELAGSAGDNQAIAASPVTFVLSAFFSRAAWKYGARAYRHCLWESGAVLADLLAIAAAEDIPCSVEMGFVDAKVNHLLGLDGAGEGSLLLVPAGRCLEWAGHAVGREVPPLNHAVGPLSESDVDQAAVRRVHTASSLVADEEIRPWRSSLPQPTPRQKRAFVSLNARSTKSASLASVVGTRGPSGRLAAAKVDLAQLSAILGGSTRGLPADFLTGPDTSLVELYVLADSVDGLTSGVYRFAAAEMGLEFLAPGFDAGLGPDSITTIFFLVALDSVLERFGNRGYRAALVEAGAVAEKMRLIANSLCLEAMAVEADENVAEEFFSPHSSGRAALGALALGTLVGGVPEVKDRGAGVKRQA